MALENHRLGRRTLLRGGLTVTAVGALGLAVPGTAGALSKAGRPSSKAAPTIIGCADWGARDPSESIEVLDAKPTYVVVHHTSGPNSDDTSKEHAIDLAKSIQDYHMDSNGWSDSGQQFTNSRGGHLLEGRHGSVDAAADGNKHVVGAHVGGHNSETVGIENEGTYLEADVPQKLWDSLVSLVSYLCSQYGVSTDNIVGHKDFNSTDCPGTVLYDRLPELREAVGSRLGVPVVQRVNWRLLKPGDTGPEVRAAQHLLRAQGARLRAGGTFDSATRRAVAEFAERHHIAPAPCSHVVRNQEPGLLGADIWPLLTTPVRPGDRGEAARAAQVLLEAKRHSTTIRSTVDTQQWKQLLAS